MQKQNKNKRMNSILKSLRSGRTEESYVSEVKLLRKRLKNEQEKNKKTNEIITQYQMLAENVSDIIWVINISQEAFSYVSPSINKVLGYDIKEILKAPIATIFTKGTYKRITQLISKR